LNRQGHKARQILSLVCLPIPARPHKPYLCCLA
jgi:hypothetical protein